MDIKGGAVIVTGSATGVGAAAAKMLAGKGCNVVINYTKSETEAKETQAACEALGAQTILCQADVASPPPIGPSSRTMTFFPARASVYAVVSPAIPAPTMHTSHSASAPSGGWFGMSAVAIQAETVEPESVFILVGIATHEPGTATTTLQLGLRPCSGDTNVQNLN
jgi:NAD(P)-dependent dehydrogenase (short-subunit alcohol dehydrogenase family)